MTVDGVDLPLAGQPWASGGLDGEADDLSEFDLAGLSGLAIPLAPPAAGGAAIHAGE